MTNDWEPESPFEAGSGEALACVEQGLRAYLEELAGYRNVCARHEGAAGVARQDGRLVVVRCFPLDGGALAHLPSSLRQIRARETVRAASFAPADRLRR